MYCPLLEHFQFRCEDCGRGYRWKKSMLRHKRLECGKEPQFVCKLCPYRGKQNISLQKHMISKHSFSFNDLRNSQEDSNWWPFLTIAGWLTIVLSLYRYRFIVNIIICIANILENLYFIQSLNVVLLNICCLLRPSRLLASSKLIVYYSLCFKKEVYGVYILLIHIFWDLGLANRLPVNVPP